jgi:type I restriction-modification system DNA methylase subunit
MNREEAKHIVRQTFERPFEDGQFKVFIANLLNGTKEAPFVYRGSTIFSDFRDHIESLERIGEYEDADNHRIDVLIVRLKRSHSLERARATQRRFVAKYLKSAGNRDAALVAFVTPDEDDWRFSFVKMQYALDTTGDSLRVQEEFTPAKRYSFLVGKNENSHTAQTRLLPILEAARRNPTLDDIEDAFSVEKVTKEFFEQYRELFLDIKDALDGLTSTDKAIVRDFRAKGVDSAEFAKKLLGQIVFLYFLQKKGWFGVARTAPWGSGPKHFLRNLFEGKHGAYQNFFNDILEPLFYNTLAVERTKDFADRFNCRIPFLNGGLFDPLRDYDWVDTDIELPNRLFSNTARTPRGDVGTGILDVFDRYNFTVKEDEPLEKEVAVDPEMLGKVFENLLEVKDRRSKGTYYTPREIVHYMCQVSLISTLSQDLPRGLDRDAIALLVEHGETAMENDLHVLEKGRETKTYSFKLPDAVRANAKLLDDRLATIKVCDPAVGSGAFLVGMMTEIVRARQVLAQFQPESRAATAYDFKRQAIQHSLYGVDIDPAAVEIAKLRLWLSLVVDEEGYELIQPLPNLDYKIMQGNSLIEEFEGIKLIDETLLTKLDEDGASRKALKKRQADVEREFLALHKAGKLTAVRRADLDKQAGQIQRQLKALDAARTSPQAPMSLFGKDAAQSIAERLLALHERFFAAYHRGEKERLREQIDQLTWALIETTLTQQKRSDKLEEVRRYQQTSVKPFFLWRLHFSEVFREKGGFDIVVANPPYVSALEFSRIYSDELREQLNARFDSATGAYDLFVLFMEQGIRLCRNVGHMAFITPNKYLAAKYASGLRGWLLQHASLEGLLDVSPIRVFKEAAVYPVVSLFCRDGGASESVQVLLPLSREAEEFDLSGYVISDVPSKWLRMLPENIWGFLLSKHVKLLPKITAHADSLAQMGEVSATSTAAEADQYGASFSEKPGGDGLKVINTGTIDRYITLWGMRQMTHAGKRFLTPYMSPKKAGVNSRRLAIYRSPKIVFAKMARVCEGAIDVAGDFASVNTNCFYNPRPDVSLKYIGGLCNSTMFMFLYDLLFGALRMSGGYYQFQAPQLRVMPIAKASKSQQDAIAGLVDRILVAKAKNPDSNTEKLEAEIDRLAFSLYGLTMDEIQAIESSSGANGKGDEAIGA